ncbi:unnamed protein product [Parnassius mnemosyne]|uniref:Sodium channel protein Nach n=1 Tax=Parnassius mnemosyne TaxID=213953 RepID=A0AAV1KLA3_9NEOP
MDGTFGALLKKFCLEGSVLGLKYFYLYPDRISRCFWTLTMLLTLCTACILSLLLYYRFDEMPTRITIENQYKSLHNLPYPAITICSPNQATISAMDHFNKTLVDGNLTLDLKKVVSQLLRFNFGTSLLEKINTNELKYLQDLIEANRYSALDVMSLLPQRCDRFLKRCIFQRKIYPCNVLFDSILTQYGMCCIFNSIYYFKQKNRNERKANFVKFKATKTGFENSLTVVTDYDPEDALEGTVLLAGSSGVMFTDWTEFPADYEASFVHPNTESFHHLYGIYTYCSEDVLRLPVSSRKCYFTKEVTLPYFREYHNSDCNLACFVMEVEDQCHCTMLYVPRVNAHRACNITSLVCIANVKTQISKWYQRCKLCLRDCVSRRYRADLILGNLDAMEHLHFNPYTGIVFNRSTSIMHFFFPRSVYVTQKQETVISLISLTSNLGGVFGLCLGCSFISLIEMWFYIYMAIKGFIRKQLNIRHDRQRVGYFN